jgi:hypothetical protein
MELHNRRKNPGGLVPLLVRMTIDLKTRIEEEAVKEQRSVSWTACILLSEALNKRAEDEQRSRTD